MKVVLLGAGASKAAGYPLANDLLPAIQHLANTTGLIELRDAWGRWQAVKNELERLYGELLTSPNPEVTLSLLDLIDIAAASGAALSAQSASVRSARTVLLQCLDWFFSSKHHDDSVSPERRGYLRREIRSLQARDVVLTLNWDTTAERTLGELGKWNPTTGYGLNCPLFFPESPEQTIPGDAKPKTLPSEVTVLKLHGSYGWHERLGHFYLSTLMLAEFGFEVGRVRVFPRHPHAPEIGPDTESVLLYPSFLKRVDRLELREVWHKARLALDQCDQLVVHGYSLPATDLAVRALLNELRFRLQDRTIKVNVWNPNAEARDRWRELLGERAQISDSRLE